MRIITIVLRGLIFAGFLQARGTQRRVELGAIFASILLACLGTFYPVCVEVLYNIGQYLLGRLLTSRRFTDSLMTRKKERQVVACRGVLGWSAICYEVSMKKYVVVFVVLVAASIAVTGYHARYEKWSQEATPKEAEVEFPVWLRISYQAVGWPEGVTVWALLLTLIAIAEQTSETRRSADVSSRSMIAQFRPKLIVRKVRMTKGTMIPTYGVSDARPWTVDFEVANVGQGTAYVLDHGFFIRRGTSGKVEPDSMALVEGGQPFMLEPGEDHQLSIFMPEDLKLMLREIGDVGLANGYQNTDAIFFFGIIKYADLLGTKRNTSVCRWFENARLRFKVVDDPDREYAD